MLQLARVRSQGLKSEGSGIQRDSGKRTGIVETADGVKYCISDLTYHEAYAGRQLIPELGKDRNGPFPFPQRNNLVIIQTAGAIAAHGPHPEPTCWMLAWKYLRILSQCLGTHTGVTISCRNGITRLVKDYMDNSFGPTNRDEWLAQERRELRFIRQGIHPEQLQSLKSYYLLGQPAPS